MKLRSHQKPHVAVVGSSDLEFSLPLSHMPTSGESIFTDKVTTRPGGRASDICISLAKLGCRVFLFSHVGLDSYGSQILNGLRNRNVNVDFVERSDHPTGMVHNMNDEEGNRIRIMASGAGLHMTKTSLLTGKAMVSACQLMIVLADISQEAFLFAIEVAHHYRIPVLAIPSPPHRFKMEWTPLIDIMLAGPVDTVKLTKTHPSTLETAEEALDLYLRHGCGAAVIYLGRCGAAASPSLGSTSFFPGKLFTGPPAPEAEDVFTAALAYSLCEVRSFNEACTFATAAAWYTHTGISKGKQFPSVQNVSSILSV